MYQRLLLKLSGEFFHSNDNTIDIKRVEKIADQIEKFIKKGCKIACVVGAGNIMRGRAVDSQKYSTVIPDYAGMLGAVINGLMLHMVLQQRGIASRIESSFHIQPVVDLHNPIKAKEHFENGEVIILGGTGLPHFSTDTAGVLFGLELGVEAVLKGTHVDGVYDKDPQQHDDAVKFDELTYDQVLQKDLQVIDSTAITLAKNNNLSLFIFQWKDSSIDQFLTGKIIGTTIHK